MKLSDLRPCDVCGEPIGIAFFRVSVEQHVVDLQAARQHMGLTAMLGGASGLAFAMGTDDDNSTKIARQKTMLLCTSCACSSCPVELMDRAEERKTEGDPK